MPYLHPSFNQLLLPKLGFNPKAWLWMAKVACLSGREEFMGITQLRAFEERWTSVTNKLL